LTKKILSASALALTALSPAPVKADPSLGVGVNITFGSKGADVGVGVRVFSNDEQDKAALSVGLDYMIKSKGLRASVGAAYLHDGSYMELNGGYNFAHQNFDFGVGGGLVKTTSKSNGKTFRACPFCGLYVCNC